MTLITVPFGPVNLQLPDYLESWQPFFQRLSDIATTSDFSIDDKDALRHLHSFSNILMCTLCQIVGREDKLLMPPKSLIYYRSEIPFESDRIDLVFETDCNKDTQNTIYFDITNQTIVYMFYRGSQYAHATETLESLPNFVPYLFTGYLPERCFIRLCQK